MEGIYELITKWVCFPSYLSANRVSKSPNSSFNRYISLDNRDMIFYILVIKYIKLMKHIQTFEAKIKKSFGEQLKYSIDDFWEDCIRHNRNMKTMSENFLEKYTDHFIGDGYYDILKDKTNRIYNILKNIETRDIELRMNSVSDEFDVLTEVKLGMLHFDDGSSGGSLRDVSKDVRDDFMVTILLDIIQPTLTYGDYQNSLRNSTLSKYVLRPTHQCVTFFQNRDIQTLIEMHGGYSDKKKIENYNIDTIIAKFKPGIWINIGTRFADYDTKGKTFTYSAIEKELNNLLPGISNNLDIEEIYYEGIPRERLKNRLFNLDMEIDDYALKIILQH